MSESELENIKHDKNYFTKKCLADVAGRVTNSHVSKTFEACRSLDDYGLYFGTDKSSNLHNLCFYYEKILSEFRQKKFNLVEFGILNCASLNMWGAYFPNANIIGIDPNGNSVSERKKRDNIIIISHDAYDYGFVKNVFKQYPPLIVVDDATHYWSHQINGFEAYFENVLPSGFYIVEDIETSYGDFRKGVWADQAQDGAIYFLELAAIVAGLGSGGVHPCISKISLHLVNMVESVSFIKDCVIITKK